MQQTAAILKAIAEINAEARKARAICTDIIRQTSHKPYYGKRGAAAVYAAFDKSEEQRKTLAEAIEHLLYANTLLVEVAQNGGASEAKVWEILRDNHNYGKGQVIKIDDHKQ